ncbi:GNAT family N-acetyltransferase [Bacillus sp. JJ722]
METVYLTRPAIELQSEYLSFYQEWKDSDETIIPWVIRKDPTDFKEMFQFLYNDEKGVNFPEQRASSSAFLLVNENRRVIGAVNIRHRLTEQLLQSSGHIGYGIRPSERQKGYATKLLALSLEKAKQLEIQKALVVCNKSTIGSEQTILNNGGV